MPKIEFRGRSYNSVFEMPDDVRKAYELEKRMDYKPEVDKMLTDFVEMSDDIREMYERAVGKAIDKKPQSQRQGRKQKPYSDDDYFKPSPMPSQSTPSDPFIEADSSLKRLAITIFLLMLLAGGTFLFLQFIS